MKRVAVVVFPGSNCERDCLWALELAGAEAVPVWYRSDDLGGADAVVLPGGFSYGDYLRAGALAARSPIMSSVRRFAQAGRPVVGICNGFQLLTETGLLPGALLMNDHLRFRWELLRLRVERTDTVVTAAYSQGDVLHVPIAHKEGCYFASSEQLVSLEKEGSVAFRYVDEDGQPATRSNPNGSLHAIAGLANASGNVVGLMPHPERRVEPVLGGCDGTPFFRSLVEAA